MAVSIIGFEIVSHPMDLDYHYNNMPWADVLKTALRLDYRSHQTETCGLHIHVDRKALGDTPMEQENTIARILYFIERHWEKLLIFSRRKEQQVIQWANRYGLLSNPKETLESAKKSYSGRYVCLNLLNHSTIEFRIFRGTLKYQTFIATLQLVDEICNRAISMSDDTFQAMNWDSFASWIDKTTKLELLKYLSERHLLKNTTETFIETATESAVSSLFESGEE